MIVSGLSRRYDLIYFISLLIKISSICNLYCLFNNSENKMDLLKVELRALLILSSALIRYNMLNENN